MRDRLLVVEGQDDKHVLWAILQYHHFEPSFEVKDEGGFENLIQRLPVYLKLGSDLERFGMIVDGDLSIGSRWESLKNILRKLGYANVPHEPESLGTLLGHPDLPRVGVWIMPDNTLPGMLEDYLSFLVPANDSLFRYAKHCVSNIPVEDRRFSEAHRTKVLIHTWLAWQADPGTPLGQAITKRYFDAECPQVQSLLAWLTRLFK